MPKRRVNAASQHGHRLRRGRAGSRRPPASQAAEPVYGVPVPAGLHDAIERERDNLGKAESLLGCLAIALEHDDAVTAPYYPDVADMARQLVRSSINGLDSLSLQRVLSRNKVEEPRCLTPLEAGFSITHIKRVSTGAAIFARIKPVRALHRRLYGRRAPARPAAIAGSPGTGHIDTPGRSIHMSA